MLWLKGTKNQVAPTYKLRIISLPLYHHHHPPPPQTINLAVNWFVFHADSGVLILSSGKAGNMLHPFQFKNQNVIKLPKFEVELSPAKGTGQSTLQVRCAKFWVIVFP